MKALIPICIACVLVSVNSGFGQEATKPATGAELKTTQPADVEAQRKQQTEKPALVPPAPAPKRTVAPVTYGGFLADVARSKQRAKMLSLRAPIATNEVSNVYTDPENGTPRGFVLLSVKF